MKKLVSDFRRFYSRMPQYEDRWLILGLILLSILISLPTAIHGIYGSTENDFFDHVLFAKQIFNHQIQEVPVHILAHPAYQLLLLGFYLVTFHIAGMYALALVLQVILQILTVALIYSWLGAGENRRVRALRVCLAVSLPLLAPVMVFAFWDKLYYLGYIGLANYHNPTIQLLKPIALLSFIYALRIFSTTHNSWKDILISGLLVIFSALAKPNYLICIFPALGVLALNFLARRKYIDWRLLILGFYLPGIIILAGQFMLTYLLPGSESGGILIDPFGVMGFASQYLLLKFILSILFPLAVFIPNYKEILGKDNALLLAWLGFLASLIPTYFLAEQGIRFSHGNFLWGSQVMAFLLFIASARFLWKKISLPGKFLTTSNILCLIAFALHLCAGIVYYIYFLANTGYPF